MGTMYFFYNYFFKLSEVFQETFRCGMKGDLTAFSRRFAACSPQVNNFETLIPKSFSTSACWMVNSFILTVDDPLKWTSLHFFKFRLSMLL